MKYEICYKLSVVSLIGPQCFLVNVIDFIIHCPGMKHPYQGTITELQFYKCFNVLHFFNDMVFDIRQGASSSFANFEINY